MRIAEADGTYQDGDAVRQESCSRIEEYADDDRQHGIGKDVDIEQVVCHHDRGYHAVEHHQCKEQRQASFPVVVVLAEQVEVKHEAQHEDADVEYLSQQCQAVLSG